jgi:hypothetical protein
VLTESDGRNTVEILNDEMKNLPRFTGVARSFCADCVTERVDLTKRAGVVLSGTSTSISDEGFASTVWPRLAVLPRWVSFLSLVLETI